MDAVDGLLEFVPGPGVAQEDDVVADGEAVALRHAIHPGEYDLIRGAARPELELGGEPAPAFLADPAVGDTMGDAGFGKPVAEDIQGIVEGAEDNGLLAFGQDLFDEGQGAVEFGM